MSLLQNNTHCTFNSPEAECSAPMHHQGVTMLAAAAQWIALNLLEYTHWVNEMCRFFFYNSLYLTCLNENKWSRYSIFKLSQQMKGIKQLGCDGCVISIKLHIILFKMKSQMSDQSDDKIVLSLNSFHIAYKQKKAISCG